jgi:hypothetical protein
MEVNMVYDLLFIAGEWRKPTGTRRIEVTSASTEEPLGGGSVRTGDPERGLDVARRVQTGSIGGV